MFTLGPLGFLVPGLLLALAALPVLWWLLRATPPAPAHRRFPGVTLLLRLRDEETTPDRTPWWLLLLRMLAAAALILGFAGPVLNPEERVPGTGPLLILADGSWASAPDWSRRQDRIAALLEEAGRDGRPVALALATDLPPEGAAFREAAAWMTRLPGLQPRPWEPERAALADWVAALPATVDTFWLSDGLARPGRQDILAELARRGEVTVFESGAGVRALTGVSDAGGRIALETARTATAGGETLEVAAVGSDPAGIERRLARVELVFAPGEGEAAAELALPTELRNRITRFEIVGQRGAGSVFLADDALARRKVALAAGREADEAQELLSPLHYLRRALSPGAELIEAPVADALLASPDVVILVDVAQLTETEEDRLVAWVEAGGTLVRFAGPRLAASDVARQAEHPLMPVRLRTGGRTVGGALSWGEPKRLRPFEADSPFHGLPVPEDVEVRAQVVAQPDPHLAERAIAALEDGTPLVTRKALGQGRVILFHVTANAEWSSLPLSGLFVQMLDRLAISARSGLAGLADLDEAGSNQIWTPLRVLDGFGQPQDAGGLAGVTGSRLAELRPGPEAPPGLYRNADRRTAVNVMSDGRALTPAVWPETVRIEGLEAAIERRLAGIVFTLALLLLAADILASLLVSGRMRLVQVARAAGTAAVVLGLVLVIPAPLRADEGRAIAATSETVLAYVLTGDQRVDSLSEAGLRGLSMTLFRRTTVEPASPMAVDIETDELAFFPMLYWPITETQARPSPEAYERLNRYLRSGGMIVFDTRDADIGGFGTATPNGRRLREIAAPLDIPPLEPVPADHVLTRTFYLIQDFPGRHPGRDVWVEASPPDAEQIEGMPFRNLNDGVTPVVIGGNDWAAAWAVSETGQPLVPVGRGFAGERQREIARRFGVNLVMYVLTGNYKSDQVHVPALLERLGQ